jgi:GH25 family lysozyme M1 (1,4-beta-N-acetylmuramidase)
VPLLIADLSNNNGDLPPIVDELHHAGFAGAIFKLSEDTGFTDARAHDGVQRARQRGLLVGGYHFLHPHSDIDAQAALFCERARAVGLWRKGDIRPALDYEIDSDNHESPKRDQFFHEVYRETGHFSMLYTGGYFNATGWLKPPRRSSALWVAGYPTYRQPAGYGRPWLHQFTDRYPVGPYRVDASRVLGGRWRLRANLCKADNRHQ